MNLTGLQLLNLFVLVLKESKIMAFVYSDNFGNGISHSGIFTLEKYYTLKDLRFDPNTCVNFTCQGCGCNKTRTLLLGQLTSIEFKNQI